MPAAKKIEKISIVIPVYNEVATIETLIQKVKGADSGQLEKEIIIVDDGSDDGTKQKLEAINDASLKIATHEKNSGKGAALRTGFGLASGEVVIIQDADLEYDPDDYGDLLKPILEGRADVVYGSRFIGDKPHRVFYFLHYCANKTLTFFSNIMTGLNLTDIETGYKVFRKEILREIKLKEKGFGFEPEFTAKIARKKYRVFEVGIAYSGRDYSQGKKINWRDGLRTCWCILKYKFFD